MRSILTLLTTCLLLGMTTGCGLKGMKCDSDADCLGQLACKGKRCVELTPTERKLRELKEDAEAVFHKWTAE